MWGRGAGYPALPVDAWQTPEYEAMQNARAEHWMWDGVRQVGKQEMLDPYGEPWSRRPTLLSGSRITHP
jgi:hypothetical protein